ncbi:MAG: nitroreductase [Erysipelotrichaceae bacterium]|nr:nitroreductase [Erysipelotrichaceae bacterium]
MPGRKLFVENIIEVMRSRHSVRQYLDKKIEPEKRAVLNECAEQLNSQGDLHIQIIYDEPECFNSRMAHYGRFAGCSNYICLIGKKSADLEEKCGYYGEMLVLKAQELGLNTCWAAMTHGKSKAIINDGEREVIVIALGYGKNPGFPHKNKAPEAVSNVTESSPKWFRNGIEAALLAPTAVNQQKFRFTLNGNKVSARHGLIGTCLKIDLGIVKCHFELGAGKENFEWDE